MTRQRHKFKQLLYIFTHNKQIAHQIRNQQASNQRKNSNRHGIFSSNHQVLGGVHFIPALLQKITSKFGGALLFSFPEENTFYTLIIISEILKWL
jgi:hypothetical protein